MASPYVKLQFSRQGDIASSAIAWFSQGDLSHVDAIIGESLYGARVSGGVACRPEDYAKFALRVVFTLPCTVEQRERWEDFLWKQFGKPYDHQAIWGFVIGRNWREDDSWICSELQAAALEYAGIVPPLYLASNKITPDSLALAISALPGVTHVRYEGGD